MIVESITEEQPLLGYRSFHLAPCCEGVRAFEQMWDEEGEPLVWEPGPLEMRCPEHTEPNTGCGCGLKAWHMVSQIPWDDFVTTVYGAVLGWGETIITEEAWYAQYQKPIVFIEHILDRDPEYQLKLVNATREHGVKLLETVYLEAYSIKYASGQLGAVV